MNLLLILILQFMCGPTSLQSNGLNILINTACSGESESIMPDHYRHLTCLDHLSLISLISKFGCLEVTERNDTLPGNQTCEFHFDWVQYDLGTIKSYYREIVRQSHSVFNITDLSWSCRLMTSSQFCNGISECLTDECNCPESELSSDLFFCADSSGCVTWENVCDNIQHCLDNSDECFCAGHVVLPSPRFGGQLCMSKPHFCAVRASIPTSFIPNKTDVDCLDKPLSEISNPIQSCLQEAFEKFSLIFASSPPSWASEYCNANCSQVENFTEHGWEKFCDHTCSGYPIPFQFTCIPNNFSETYPLTTLCDGQVDCSNQADEMGCPHPDRFYCSPNITAEWVSIDRVCDNVKDCVSGADECGTCDFGALSSAKFLIQSQVVLAFTSIMGILIVVMNLREGYALSKMTPSSKNKDIDRVFLLQIFFHDLLMGAYLCSIVLAAIVLKIKGDYCTLEQKWRASFTCSMFGVIFSFSSHGSLLAIAAISITRFLVCHSLVSGISKRAVIFSSVLTSALNLLHSYLPMLPISTIRETFRTGLIFEHLNENPFFNTNPVNISRIEHVYQGMLHNEEGDVYKMLNDLKNISTKPEIFDVLEISYYGNTGLCVHNIFKYQVGSHEIYKILYCSVLLVLLGIVSFAYIKIVLKQRQSAATILHVAATANQGATTANQGSTTSNQGATADKDEAKVTDDRASANADLTIKVVLMIGSQLLSWISFILTVLYFQYWVKKPASPLIFEAFSLVVIPANSFLNPVFYSGTYKSMKMFLSSKWSQLVKYLTPIQANVPTNSNISAPKQATSANVPKISNKSAPIHDTAKSPSIKS